MSVDLVHFQGRRVQSPLSKRWLWVNDDPQRALIPEDADLNALAQLCEACAAPEVTTLGLTRRVSANQSDIAAFMNPLFECLVQRARRTPRLSVALQAFVVDLWERGLLALPPALTHWCRQVWRVRSESIGSLLPTLRDLDVACTLQDASWKVRAVGGAWQMHLMVCGARDLNDLTAETHPLALLREHKWVNTARAIERLRGPETRSMAHSDRLWTKYSDEHIKRDRTFRWALEKDASLSDWADALGDWVDTFDRRKPYVAANKFLNYLIAHPEIVRHPGQFCHRDYRPDVSFGDWIAPSVQHVATRVQAMQKFFEWLLDHRLTVTLETGWGVRSRDHVQPLASENAIVRTSSVRDAMPTRYVRDLLVILTENDWAWARAIRRDHVTVQCRETGKRINVWSPVRAMAIALKLLLPLRTFQVRMLASDEGDSRRYRAGSWVDAERQASIGDRPQPRVKKTDGCQGFLREFDGFTGFYVNTNKTHDSESLEQQGYEIPWQNERAIALVSELMEWQRRYNPSDTPLAWTDVDDPALQGRRSDRSLMAAGSTHFLFRDPAHDTDPRQPASDATLRNFWIKLLKEYERRLAASGKTDASGRPVRLVVKEDSQTHAKPVFDLHCLRVTLLTGLAVEGGVPLWVLSKLAGHTTVMMTLLYIKASAPYINAQLDAAEKKMANEEQDNFLRFVQSQERQAVRRVVAVNDDAAIDVLKNGRAHAWSSGPLGVCPADGGLCHVGGPALNEKRTLFGPVAGGAGNCVRCRFFVTGPPWLAGLVARFNAIVVRLRSLQRQEADTRSTMESMEMKLQNAPVAEPGRPPTAAVRALHHHLSLATQAHHTAIAKLMEEEQNWRATGQLIARCKTILDDDAARMEKDSPDCRGPALVPVGTRADVEIAVRECSTFTLFDSVCQSARFFPGEDITEALLRRSESLNLMLANNTRPAYFLGLSDHDALHVGNAFTSLLRAQFGEEAIGRMVDGVEPMPGPGEVPALDDFFTSSTLTLQQAPRALMPLPTPVSLTNCAEADVVR